jgi:hypothetical protein
VSWLRAEVVGLYRDGTGRHLLIDARPVRLMVAGFLLASSTTVV